MPAPLWRTLRQSTISPGIHEPCCLENLRRGSCPPVLAFLEPILRFGRQTSWCPTMASRTGFSRLGFLRTTKTVDSHLNTSLAWLAENRLDLTTYSRLFSAWTQDLALSCSRATQRACLFKPRPRRLAPGEPTVKVFQLPQQATWLLPASLARLQGFQKTRRFELI